MFARIQYCFDGTGDVKSKWGLFMLHQITLLFKNFSVEFMQVSCFYLGFFLKHCVHFRNLSVEEALPSKGASLTLKQVVKQLDWFLFNTNFNPKYTMFSLQNWRICNL